MTWKSNSFIDESLHVLSRLQCLDWELFQIQVNELSSSTEVIRLPNHPNRSFDFPSLAFRHRINKNKTWIRKKRIFNFCLHLRCGRREICILPFFLCRWCVQQHGTVEWQGKNLFVFRRESSPTDPFMNSVLCFVTEKKLYLDVKMVSTARMEV